MTVFCGRLCCARVAAHGVADRLKQPHITLRERRRHDLAQPLPRQQPLPVITGNSMPQPPKTALWSLIEKVGCDTGAWHAGYADFWRWSVDHKRKILGRRMGRQWPDRRQGQD